MFFLNPAVLLGLFAAILPILIHLLNLERRQKIYFGSIALLEEIKQNAFRRFQVRRWFLLLLRSLAIMCIVAAFSKPILEQLPASRDFVSQTSRAVVIIFDTSPSMQYTDRYGQSLWRNAKAITLDLLSDLWEGDEVYLDLTGESTPFNTPFSLDDARKAIINAEDYPLIAPIEERLILAFERLATSAHTQREVYVISDFHPGGFFSIDSLLGRKVDAVRASTISLFLLSLSPPEKENTFISSIDIQTKLLEPRKPVRFSVSLERAPLSQGSVEGTSDNERPIKLFLDDKLSAEKTVSLLGSQSSANIIASPTKSGYVRAMFELPDDPLPHDNRFYSVFFIPEKINVLLLYHDPREAMYLRLALDSYQDSRFFEVTALPFSTLPTQNLAAFDAVIAVGVRALDIPMQEKLKRFSSDGGGLILFPGYDAAEAQLNPFLQRLGLGHVSEVHRYSAANPAEKLEERHPLFEGMFSASRKRTSVETPSLPEFRMLWSYQKSSSETALLSMRDGKSVITVKRLQSGRIVFSGGMPILESGNFVLHPLFPPFLYRSILYTSRKIGQESLVFESGNEHFISLPAQYVQQQLLIKSPKGKETIASIRTRGGESALWLTPSVCRDDGFYTVLSQETDSTKTPLLHFAINHPRTESEYKAIDLETLTLFGKQFTSNVFALWLWNQENPSSLKETIAQSRKGYGIWKILLAVALVLLLTEGYLGRKYEI